MLYVEKIENHKIGNNTPFVDVAISLGWTLTIDENDTEKAYDGSLWEKGYAPQKPQEVKEDEVRAVRNQYLETYVDPKQLVMVWNSLTAEEQELYKDYRQYLLDYPQTEGWYEQNPDDLKTFAEKRRKATETIK